MSYRCVKCYAYFSEWNEGYLCPECKRSEAFARQQAQSQREVERSSHLNEIKRKLLDLAIEGTEDRETASQKVAILVRSSDFSENLNWFWPEVAANDLLLDVYFSEVLKPLAVGSQNDASAVEFFDGLNHNARELVGQWLAKQPYGGRWDEGARKYRHYDEIIRERGAAQKRQAEENARLSALEQTQRNDQQAKENAKRQAAKKRSNLLGSLAAFPTTLIFLGAFLFAGSLKLSLWIERGAQASVGLFGILGLILTLLFFIIARDYTKTRLMPPPQVGSDETLSILGFLYVGGMALILWMTWSVWPQLSGPARIGLIAAAIAVPLAPLVRGVLGSAAFGIVAGLISLLVSYIVGGILAAIFGWVMKS